MFCKAAVVPDYLSPSLLVVSIDLSTAWLALGLQHCLEVQGIVSRTKLAETFLGLRAGGRRAAGGGSQSSEGFD